VVAFVVAFVAMFVAACWASAGGIAMTAATAKSPIEMLTWRSFLENANQLLSMATEELPDSNRHDACEQDVRVCKRVGIKVL
jgi:hypothetical protein